MALNLGKIQAERTYQMVARSIEEEILSGRVPPGESLPSEEKLAVQLGVNRSTVREALRVLEQHGLVRREPGRKKLLASIPRHSEISKPLSAAMILHQVTFEELWQAMHALEPATAAVAATKVTPALLASLDTNLQATRKAIADADSNGLVALDIEFHNLIAEASQNRAIQLARQPLSEFFYPAFYAVMTRLNAGERLLVAHEHIVNALKNHDVRDATSWMDKHIADFQRGFELANLDITQPVARREENGDVRPFRDAPAAGAEPAANEPRVELA
ncbi:MAG TPA: FCD domain-containing protein [Ramlibacter sp.]|uniref:FadR/GntR family transcriptional regulator n=1 Tax=Ramlibacter sp. TaxID=1917967 RepID=UPI002CB7D256|nr:FCD domain-containing protein [Ramlibacter sp.]HVZ45231.1 FCD domain-containing protein [Ramlibacter sp.]